MEVMVADIIFETADTTTLVLFTGNDRLEYRSGHFLTIDPHQFAALQRFIAFFEDTKGKKEPPRAYSMSSAPAERYLAITVKEERYISGQTQYPPLLSPLLVRQVSRGMRMVVTGFTGPYVLPEDAETRTEHLVHICAGSGIVPNFAILKHALVHQPRLRHTLIYSNRSESEIIFREPLAQLARAHADRLRIVHTLTRETDPARFGPDVRRGRIATALLREHIPDPQSCLIYACGPAISTWDRRAAAASGAAPTPRFLEAVLASAAELGVPEDRIVYESYG
jgi:ferredoxin-NADP reductase